MENLEQQFSEHLSLTNSSSSVDAMIIQTLNLLDERDTELNKNWKRLRECYGRHFPELSKTIRDDNLYAKSITFMGNWINATKLNFSEILGDEVEVKLKEAALISKGTECSDFEKMQIRELCDKVITLADQRAHLYDCLISIMNRAAPNLSALVGEVVGARLISCGGGLLNLVKQGKSIEKLFTSLLKEKHDIPKHGLICQISQAARKLKRKMTRSLAAKAALVIRCDAFGDGRNNTIGLKSRAQLEARFMIILEGKPRIKVVKTCHTDTDSLPVQTPTKFVSEAMDIGQ